MEQDLNFDSGWVEKLSVKFSGQYLEVNQTNEALFLMYYKGELPPSTPDCAGEAQMLSHLKDKSVLFLERKFMGSTVLTNGIVR